MSSSVVIIVAVAVVGLFFVLRMLAGGDRIDGEQARDLLADGAQLVDVRTPQEFRAGHIDGATNIPVADIGGRTEELDQSQPVIVYCRSGARSARAARVLTGQGFDARDLGPMAAW